MLTSVSASVFIHIIEVTGVKLPYIPYITKFSKTLGYKYSAPQTYQHLNHNEIIQNEPTTNTVSPKKYLVALLKMVNSCNIYVRKKMLYIFTSWFEEDVIPLNNDFKNQLKQTNVNKILQLGKLFTISRRFSKTYFVYANIFRKNLTIQLSFWGGNIIFVK